jgi:putative selenate reductase
VGAGPAGLSCAYRLAERGAKVTVFESSQVAGGVPVDVIPLFRIPREDIAKDIDRLASLGVEFKFGAKVEDPRALLSAGHSAVFIGSGAPVAKPFELSGGGVDVVDALDFLRESRKPGAYPKVRHVVVMGGGNTAMDACRAATRLAGKPTVSLSYRRTFAEMPADREELENALAEGSVALPLTLPESAKPGALALRVMELGEADASGRRSPKPTGETREVPCDLLVAAVGESPDASWFSSFGAKVGPDGKPAIDRTTKATSVPGVYAGGDAARGPSSIIAAEADGRAAAMAILSAARVKVPAAPASLLRGPISKEDIEAKRAKRGDRRNQAHEGCPSLALREADRCLQCDSVCLRCVEVCPNRANTFVEVDGFEDRMQVVHIDALCNECGNCGFFCPYDGRPYEDKPTLFDSEADMAASGNPGFAIGPGAAPALAIRRERGGERSTLAWEAWRPGAPSDDRMVAIAREVLVTHSYLLGGKGARA